MEKQLHNRILQKAEELFLRYNNVRSITMDDIAHHLGISKKTLYQYFADKDAIVSTVTEQHATERQSELEKIHAKAENAVDELVAFSDEIKEQMKNISPALLHDVQKYHQKAWDIWQNFKDRFIKKFIIRNVKEGIKQGYYRDDLEPQIMAGIRLELVHAGFDEQLFPRDRFNMQEVQAQLMEHFAYGMLTEKGMKLYKKYKMAHA